MKNIILSGILILLMANPLLAQRERYFPEKDTAVLRKLDQWQDLKFGLLMHWGPYSQWGVVESWSICGEDEDWCRRKNEDYQAYLRDYENLKTTFNPVKFDPARWAKAARDAGMKYVVFTTKHHDGFCMFDTKLTDYKVTDRGCPFSSNPKSNITLEIFKAFRAEGLWTGAYFSKPDWHCPDYWWRNFPAPDRNVNYDIKHYPERWEKYVQYTQKQIDELLTDYGKVDILWLDGGWVAKRSPEDIKKAINSPDYKFTREQSQDIRMDEIKEKARKKQPGIIVVDRAVEGPNQNYLTPENQVPKEALPFPWESCIIAGGGWSWVANANYKSAHVIIGMLADIVSKGGNLLLNIAPGPDGSWDADAYDRLSEVGAWMKRNSEAIYGTRAIKPYREGNICYTNKKGTKMVYAICLSENANDHIPAVITLNGLVPGKGKKVRLLGYNSNLKWEKAGNGARIFIPESVQKNSGAKYAWVVGFEI